MNMPNALTLPVDGGSNGTWGATLNAALTQINGYDQFAYKTADQDITSSTTLTDDTHLTGLALGIGKWVICATFMSSGAAAGDVKIAWAFSGTAVSAFRAGEGPAAASTDVLGATAQPFRASVAGATSAAITSATPYGVDGTNRSFIQESGLLLVTVAGNLKVQWAQNASSVTLTRMHQGSFIWARKVSD
jgi:hypothetical protein